MKNTPEPKINWVSHFEWVGLMITIIGGFYLMDGKIERQSARTDRFYEMFVENQRVFHEEIKQIHGRLCVIERQNRN